ncbi:Leader peptidase (Prepilin peptidase) (EC / N-methyltransferase (EC [uncultured Gammaproteobacteria bacterium]|jgi:leader peptidase (prepilin peptidase)/N-methyltransferase|nr:Leader peptidase (Prepilin peptidase) (EC 3.4.23.43) / N-methyltransferase (EC 2.1.1.-) [uncultured Gammaproteobacteria bacterium]CAC9441985.1 Leader peptidase (Prepilin peptidase) (EC 3.4.23.43) / N-methyltransferase (EC 2.1.1.-) [uncultured Gammaproteobacteria bacterium]VVH66499.1 Leader peptidase (Prepilin peptidase) (EC / N-methyltransferase (EC [uncultured Gammaproteobacteria bacterium]
MIVEIIIATTLGLFIGSFLNVVIYRLPLSIYTNATIDLINPKRSFCPVCKQKLSALELVPIFSYLAQKGKCKHCGTTISWQYPLVETMTAFISAFIVFMFGATIESGFYLLLAWLLIPLFVIDLKGQLLPDVLTLSLMWIGFIYQMQFGDLQNGVIGAMAGYLLLWSMYWLFKIIKKKEGMGYGDFKLLAALGAWIGWQAIPQLLLSASVLGLIFFVLSKTKKDQTFAFGPFLIVGFLFVKLLDLL